MHCEMMPKSVTSAERGTEQFAGLVEFQSIATRAASKWKSFAIAGRQYLAVANFEDGSSKNVDSKIYRWSGTSFGEYQSIATSGAKGWEFFVIAGTPDGIVGSPARKPPSIQAWTPTS